MPPRTRNQAARHPSSEPAQQPQSIVKRRKVKKPLQDVTESYISSRHNTPIKKAQSSKLKAPSKAAINLSSSLPPSSPIAISSAIDPEEQRDVEEVQELAEQEETETLPYCSDHEELFPAKHTLLTDDDDFQFDVDDDRYLNDPPLPEEEEEEAPADNTDIFGFFAVERELKENPLRFSRPLAPEVMEERSHVPPTPHPVRIMKRKASTSPEPSESPSFPASPSPKKHSIGRLSIGGGVVDLSFVGDEEEESKTPKPPRRSTRTRLAAPPSKKPRLEPAPLVDLSFSTPPSTPARTRKTARSVTTTTYAGESSKPKSRSRPPPSATRKPRSKRTAKPLDAHEEEEEDPEVVAERQRRIDYFKQLDSYSVTKEDVYIV